MTRTYHCDKCGRDIIAPSTADTLKKVRYHDRFHHGISEYSTTQLLALRRRIDHSRDL